MESMEKTENQGSSAKPCQLATDSIGIIGPFVIFSKNVLDGNCTFQAKWAAIATGCTLDGRFING